jgi:hypothetical protein
MISAETNKTGTFINHFRLDAGIFNGQGLTAPENTIVIKIS